MLELCLVPDVAYYARFSARLICGCLAMAAAAAASKDDLFPFLKALPMGITSIKDFYDRENPWFGARTRANDHDRLIGCVPNSNTERGSHRPRTKAVE